MEDKVKILDNCGGFGTAVCMMCGHVHGFDIFEYENIIEKDNKLWNECPRCRANNYIE